MKDKLYDFGELGKWSTMTLKARAEIAPSDSVAWVDSIERSFKKKMDAECSFLCDMLDRKIKGKKLVDFVVAFDTYKDGKVRKELLKRNYDYYKEILHSIVFGEK